MPTQKPTAEKKTECFIGLGSNLNSRVGNPFRTLQSSLTELEQVAQIKLLAVSSCYISKPHGPQNQNDFLNAVVKIETTLSAIALLQTLQAIENFYGRERKSNQHWGPRTLDLDILLFGQNQINTKNLIIPHPQINQREFVLLPLMELDPFLELPNGKKLKSLAEKCPQNGIIKLDQPLWY